MKRAKLKNNSKRKKFFNIKLKFLFFVLIVGLSIFFTTKYLIDNDDNITKEEYVNYLLNKSFLKKNDNKFLFNEGLKKFTKIDLSNPSTLLSSSIKNSKNNEKKEYLKDAKGEEDDYQTSSYDKITSYIENSSKKVSNPKIYLYNTHQLETYSSGGLENSNITPNVMMGTYLLAENLNNNGINTIVEDTNVAEFIRISGFDSDSFYASTRIFLKNAMNKYNSLEYFIDFHRDSVSKDISTCVIDNKNYARILFVLGTSHDNYKQNEEIMSKLDEISDKLYPGLSRGIYKKETPDWPLVYNQDLNKGVLLIEVGGKDNTIDEVINTTVALSNILKEYIKGE